MSTSSAVQDAAAGLDKPVRVGIIGCGKIAINHVMALQGITGVTVVGVCDVDVDRARQFADEYGIPEATADTDSLFALSLDAVTVCTPHPVHEAGVLAAARARVHVLCEKPIAVTLDEADRMIAATRAAGIHFGVLFQRRFWPSAQRISAAIDSGQLCQPIVSSCILRFNREAEYESEPWRGRWNTEGGGALINQTIHFIDHMLWFMGPAVRVTGKIATLAHSNFIEVEDTAVATVEFASGALAVIQASSTFNPGLGVQLLVSDKAGQSASILEFPEGSGQADFWVVGDEREAPRIYDEENLVDRPLAEIHAHLVPFHRMQIEEFTGPAHETE